MLETITLITLSLLLMSILRPGKTPPLDNPLVIECPGQYHMTLAPKINLAQPFIEAVAKQLDTANSAIQYSATQYFEVRDNQVTAHGHDCYLLAITQRNGLLYFQAASPSGKEQNSQRETICKFAEAVLVRFPATGEYDSALDERIVAAAQATAQLRMIHIKHLA